MSWFSRRFSIEGDMYCFENGSIPSGGERELKERERGLERVNE